MTPNQATTLLLEHPSWTREASTSFELITSLAFASATLLAYSENREPTLLEVIDCLHSLTSVIEDAIHHTSLLDEYRKSFRNFQSYRKAGEIS